ncbi:MAG: ubiquitin-like domain-containing protein [bacterium]|nr:ubiquitin-like domain-containing protein [bacterium]
MKPDPLGLPEAAPPTPPTHPRPPTQNRQPGRWLAPLTVMFGLGTFALAVALFAVLTTLSRAFPVTLVIDGEAYAITARALTVESLLRQLDIDPASGDSIQPPPDTPLQPDMLIRIARARTVTLMIDGTAQLLWTPLTNPAAILAGAGVTLNRDDQVMIDGTPADPAALEGWPIPVSHISVRRVTPITVVIEGEAPRPLRTTQITVGEALYEAGIDLFLADTVSVDLNSAVQRDMTITIRRASPITVIADGDVRRARAQGQVVADALSEAGVSLVGLDYAIPAADSPLVAGMAIRVIRVRETFETTDAPIPYEVVYQADPALELDQQRVIQGGQPGIERTRIRVRYENEIAIEREVEAVEIAAAPVNQVIGYGTNVVIRTLDTPDGPIQYYRQLRMYATSYHPAALGGDNVTATGATLQRGIVGANPTLLPYSTRIYVPNYGVGSIEDTGGPRSSPYWIDLGYSDADYRPWARYVDVYLLAPPPAALDYLLPDWTPLRGRPDSGN